jgi:hypothetical protein
MCSHKATSMLTNYREGGGLIREQHLCWAIWWGWFEEFACMTVPCPTNVPSAETVEISHYTPSLRLLNSLLPAYHV